MTQNCHYVGRYSYRIHLENKPHALPFEPNELVILETYTICVPTWNSICERSRNMAWWQRFRLYSELFALILDQDTTNPG
jgi:hypothetical protein